MNTAFNLTVPLGSIQELPAESCDEIKRSEGHAVSGKYWFSTIKSGTSVLAYCNMDTTGTLSLRPMKSKPGLGSSPFATPIFIIVIIIFIFYFLFFFPPFSPL